MIAVVIAFPDTLFNKVVIERVVADAIAQNAAASILPKRSVPANRSQDRSRLCLQRSSGPEIH
jgi:hypothetical protein